MVKTKFCSQGTRLFITDYVSSLIKIGLMNYLFSIHENSLNVFGKSSYV